MSERAEVFEGVQIGVETVPGTAVAATKRLSALGITAGPELTSSLFMPRGRKLNTLAVPGRRSTTGTLDGRLTYTEIVYPVTGLLGAATITTPAGATLAREWAFDINPSGPDGFKTFTVEVGPDGGVGSRFSHGLITGLTFSFGSEEITLGGDIIGRKWEDPFTLTTGGGVTDVALIPVDPNDVSIYVDETYEDLGTTLMERLFSADFGLTGKYGPIWPINAANPSWATAVELAPDATMGLTFAADAVGMGFLDVFEEGATRFVRIEAVGPEIETDQDYLFRADFAVKAQSMSFEGVDGVVGAAWSLTQVDDPDLAGIEILVRNALAAL